MCGAACVKSGAKCSAYGVKCQMVVEKGFL